MVQERGSRLRNRPRMVAQVQLDVCVRIRRRSSRSVDRWTDSNQTSGVPRLDSKTELEEPKLLS